MTEGAPSVPAGWLPDPGDPTRVRWWDGAQWTAETRPRVPDVSVAAGAPASPQKTTKPFYRRTWVLITAAIIVLFGAIGALGNSGDKKSESAAVSSTADVAAQPTVDAAATASAAAKVEADQAAQAAKKAADDAAAAAAAQAAADASATAEAAKGTVSQQNAYKSAQSYLDFSAFSRAGLLRQLTSAAGEGYPAADAEFAVARLESEGGVDWNAEAAKSAKSYLKMTSFSRKGLIEQLTSTSGEGFTPAQAEYGVSAAGL